MAPHHGVANQLVTCINQVPLGRLLFEQRCRQLDGSDKSQPDREAYFHAITDAVHGSVVSSTILASTQAARKRQSHKLDRKSTRLNSSHSQISYAVFCLKKKNTHTLRPFATLFT